MKKLLLINLFFYVSTHASLPITPSHKKCFKDQMNLWEFTPWETVVFPSCEQVFKKINNKDYDKYKSDGCYYSMDKTSEQVKMEFEEDSWKSCKEK